MNKPAPEQSLRPHDADQSADAYATRRPTHVIETVQTVLTALMLAFVFRAFVVEAFIIPTGSMAHSLLGAHATRTCPACGWEYDFVPGHDCLCPNCHLRTLLATKDVPQKAGDRILVHKWPYLLGGIFGPRRWDVVVFRNPSDPTENYIKRLIALPGETIEIIDGDVYIDGHIARKTPAAQDVLWFLVFDQRHPTGRGDPSISWPRWVADPLADESATGWTGLDTRVIRYASNDDRERTLRFEPGDDAYFRDVYAYNRGPSNWPAPLVGDVRMLGELTFRAGEGACRWVLTRDESTFDAEVRRDGTITLHMASPESGGTRTVIGRAELPRFRADRPYVIEIGHIDHRAYVKINRRTVIATSDEQYHPDLPRLRTDTRSMPVDLRITARTLDLELRGLRIDRDVHYTFRPHDTRRAYAGHPFVLNDDEYFALGDNSPDSRDSREWTEQGLHIPSGRYQIGTVPADQIVGPAAFVYLPGLLPQDDAGNWRLPDLGRVRFIR